jgi:hypothetical protein
MLYFSSPLYIRVLGMISVTGKMLPVNIKMLASCNWHFTFRILVKVYNLCICCMPAATVSSNNNSVGDLVCTVHTNGQTYIEIFSKLAYSQVCISRG